MSMVLGSLVLVSYLAIMKLSLQLVSHRFELPEPPLPAAWVSTDAAVASQRALGEKLVGGVLGCRNCHGPDLLGQALLSDPASVLAHSANLRHFAAQARDGAQAISKASAQAQTQTPAQAHLLTPAAAVDAAWVRALRYGLRDDGRALWLMPQTALSQLDDAELAAVVAHLRALPGDGESSPTHQLGALGRIRVAFKQLALLDLGSIRGNTPEASSAEAPPRAVSLAYGAHLVAIGRCASCHGQATPAARAGALPLPAGPTWHPPALRRTGEAAFARALAEGRRLDGAPLTTGAVGHDYASLDALEVGALWVALTH